MFERLLEVAARHAPLAAHAAHPVEPPVQVDHSLAARRLVQAVDVLGQQQLAAAHRFETREGAVRGVGAHLPEVSPAHRAARPVPLPRREAAHEELKRHRLRPLPRAGGVAVVRDARSGAASGAGQDEETAMPVDEVGELGGRHGTA